MSEASPLHRHYRIPDLNFRDFWDICSQYQRLRPKYRCILYTVEGFGQLLVENESDISIVLQTIAKNLNQVRRFTARFYLSELSEPGDYGNSKLEYLPETVDFLPRGLHFYSPDDDKLIVYKLEDYIFNSYYIQEELVRNVEYGLPCEVLTAVIDMRGFSSFCEQANIESPYTCGLMTAFYGMVHDGFKRYPPDLVKFLGDGVLAIWQTNARDREVAIEACINGLLDLAPTWKQIIRGPEFSHGAPSGIGAGVSFGLASKISIGNDYLGRPINLASRLCGVCPPSTVYIDSSVPDIAARDGVKSTSVRLKSFGDKKAWMLLSS